MTPEPEPPKPRRKLTPLWKRLPLILLGLAGIWLWQGGGGLVSTEHHVVWKVPGAYASVRRVEAELWEKEELLARIEIDAPAGLTLDPEKTLTLRRGMYRSELRVWRQGASQPEVRKVDFEVGPEPAVVIR